MTLTIRCKRILNNLLRSRSKHVACQRLQVYYSTASSSTITTDSLSARRDHTATPVATPPSLTHPVLKKRGPPSRVPTLSTLDHRALLPSDYIDLSDKRTAIFRVGDPTHHAVSPANDTQLYYSFKAKGVVPFPPGTQGFFYVYWPTTTYVLKDDATGEERKEDRLVHPAAGHLRFRIVDSPHPERFDEGHDLTMGPSDPRPWKFALITMYRLPHFHHIYSCITTDTQRAQIDSFIAHSKSYGASISGGHGKHCDYYDARSHILESVLEPFCLDCSRMNIDLILLDSDCITRLHFNSMFVVQPVAGKIVWDKKYAQSPYSGKALCRFELVHLVRKQQEPVERLTIRLLQWIERPSPDDELKQEEGELLRRWDLVSKRERPWVKRGYGNLPRASVEMLKDAFPTSETIEPRSLAPSS